MCKLTVSVFTISKTRCRFPLDLETSVKKAEQNIAPVGIQYSYSLGVRTTVGRTSFESQDAVVSLALQLVRSRVHALS